MRIIDLVSQRFIYNILHSKFLKVTKDKILYLLRR